MDLKDATLMMLSESAGHPAVASIARNAHERLVNEEPVDYRLLDDLIGEASGKGVLRALRAKYGPVGFEAIVSPILTEIGRQKPIRSGGRSELLPIRCSRAPGRRGSAEVTVTFRP